MSFPAHLESFRIISTGLYILFTFKNFTMKQLFTLLFLVCLSTAPVLAQLACVPDTLYRDSLGVFPLPYDPIANPDGGVTQSACINKPYEFVFTVAVGDSIAFGGVKFSIDSITLNPQTAIAGLPSGISYACNPPSCTFRKDVLGCLVLSGTADATNAPGEYSLEISGNIYSGSLPLAVTFPDPIIAAGEYVVTLNAENSADCTTVGIDDVLSGGIRMAMQPNPAYSSALVVIEVPTAQHTTFQIHDVVGKLVYQQKVQLVEGENQLSVDVSQLPNGIYTYSLNNGTNLASRRMVVSH